MSQPTINSSQYKHGMTSVGSRINHARFYMFL